MTESNDAQFRTLIANAALLLRRAGFEGPARKLESAPIRAANRYGCAARALFAVELAIRADHAVVLHGPGGRHAAAIETVGLVRVALDAVATGAQTGPWLETLAGRQRALLRVVDPASAL